MKTSTFKILSYSLLLIFIIHFLLKNILLHFEMKNEIEEYEEYETYNIGDNNVSQCNNAPGMNNTMTDMKKDLLDFLDENESIYSENKQSNLNIKNNSTEFDPLSKNHENADFSSNLSDLDKFFEKNSICESSPQIELNTKNSKKCENNNQWEYQDENIMNGGAIHDGLFGFDNIDSNWAQCDNTISNSIECT